MTTTGLLLAWIAWVVGSQPAGTPWQPKFRLFLSTTESRAYERMPIPFDVNVMNLSDERIRIGLILKPVFHKWVHVLYRRVPEGFRTLGYTTEWDVGGHPDFEHFTLNGGGQDSFALSLGGDPVRNAFIFDRPGEYEIQVICDDRHGPDQGERHLVETPPLRIHVEPAPPSEAAALEDWGVDLAIFAQNDGGEGGPRFRQSLSRALTFMDAHPTSHYSELLRTRSLETLELLRREGKELTEIEREGYERLKRKPAQ